MILIRGEGEYNMAFLINLSCFWFFEFLGLLLRNLLGAPIVRCNKNFIWKEENAKIIRLYDVRSRTLKKFCVLDCDGNELIVKQFHSDYVGKIISIITDGEVTFRIKLKKSEFITLDNIRLLLLLLFNFLICFRFYMYINLIVITFCFLFQIAVCFNYRNIMKWYFKENA